MNTDQGKPARACRECGAPLPAGPSDAVCPVCVLSGALTVASPPRAEGVVQVTETLPCAPPEPTSSPFTTTRLGDYELLEEIARGGMGVVYRARQISLNRIVAVKMILPAQGTSSYFVQRFRVEAEAAARLQHSNIIAIHEVGEHEGRHFFSMEYVEGQNLQEVVRQKPLSPKRAAGYMQILAEAIHYAHRQGILHRDLKPSNVLIDAWDQPKITDFGLAKVLTSGAELTLSGQVMGTPHFLPPEQASGKRDAVGPCSDVYGLGAILYYLLTGQPPFRGEELTEVLEQVLHREPVSPRVLNPSVPRDLETICLKCLEKEPARRYGTAAEMGEDLGRHLKSETIVARPVSPPEKAWRWCRRKPALAAALAACVIAVFAGIAGISWLWQRAKGEAIRANLGELQAQRNLYAADMMLGFTALGEHDYSRVRSLLANHVPGKNLAPSLSGQVSLAAKEDLRGWEWRYLWGESRSDELTILGKHSNAVVQLDTSPDGTLLASGSGDQTVKIWDLKARRLLVSLPHQGTTHGLAFSPDGAWLATASVSEAGDLRLWRVGHWATAELLTTNTAIAALAFSANSRYLVTSSSTELQVWDVMARRELAARNQLNRPGHVWCHVAFAASDSQILVTLPGGEALLWDWQGTHEPERFRLQNDSVFDLHWMSSRGLLATAGGDRNILVWDPAARKEIARISTVPYWTQAVRFSPNGALLASGGEDQRITLWDTTSWKPVRFLRGHSGRIFAMVFIPPEGRLLATGSADGTIRLWELASEPKPVDSLDWWEGWWWAERSDGGGVNWRSAPTSEPPFDKSALSGVVCWPTAVSSLGQMAAGIPDLKAADPGGTIYLWDLKTGALRQTIRIDEGSARSLALSRDGRSLAAIVEASNTVHLWNAEDGKELSQFETRAGLPMPMKLAIAPNCQNLAIGWQDGRVDLWSVGQGRCLGEIAPQGGRVTALSYSPDGTLLASTGEDDLIRLVRLGDPPVCTILEARLRWPVSADISIDGRTLAVGDSHGQVHLFSIETGQQIGRLPLNQGIVSARGNIETPFVLKVEFLPDGDRLLAIAYRHYWARECLVRVWSAAHIASTDL